MGTNLMEVLLTDLAWQFVKSRVWKPEFICAPYRLARAVWIKPRLSQVPRLRRNQIGLNFSQIPNTQMH